MSDLVARLRDWRSVHLARLHLLMEEAADEMERLSQNGDCPETDNRANADNVGRKLAQDATDALTDDERAAIESAIWDYAQNDEDEDCARMVATLESLLERME